MVEDDEKRLVARCLAGDEDARTGLVDAYARMVGMVIWRATADHDLVEDLAQDTFLRVFRCFDEIDDALRQESRWDPPRGFARRVVHAARQDERPITVPGIAAACVGAVRGLLADSATTLAGFAWTLRQYWLLLAR